MAFGSTLLALLDMGFVALLPVIFFRRDGRLNLRWLLTAAPFMANIVLLVAGLTGWAGPLAPDGVALSTALESLGVLAACGSIALIAYTIGSHRVPLALWHQDQDAPSSIVTWGAYARVRHPFYTAFLLGLVGVVCVFPHAVSLGALVYAAVALNVTAAREERRLAASQFGAEYREYLTYTGRFFPGSGRPRDTGAHQEPS